jgi:hypothetical protein
MRSLKAAIVAYVKVIFPICMSKLRETVDDFSKNNRFQNQIHDLTTTRTPKFIFQKLGYNQDLGSEIVADIFNHSNRP